MTENRADYLLAVAIEMRMTARGMRYPEARHQMAQIARHFERLAQFQETELEEEALPFEVIVAAWAENTATRA
jgi:hypothetical protein